MIASRSHRGKLVEVASQSRLEAEQKKLAAAYKQEQTLRGEGDAAYKRLVMKADGAPAKAVPIFASMRVMRSSGKAKWVPEEGGGGSETETPRRSRIFSRRLATLGQIAPSTSLRPYFTSRTCHTPAEAICSFPADSEPYSETCTIV